MESFFQINDNKGFLMTFGNGYSISVQFGAGNYGDNYNARSEELRAMRNVNSTKAEIAMWGADDKMFVFGSDGEKDFVSMVAGYLTTDEVFTQMAKVAALPPQTSEAS